MTKQNKNKNGGMRTNKTRTRGVGTNSAIVTSCRTVDLGVADVGGRCYSGARLDPMNQGVVTLPVASIAGAYEFYRLISAKVTIIPTGGSQAPGSVQAAYIDNPEIASVYSQAVNTPSPTTCSQIITNEEGAETFTLQAMSAKSHKDNRITARRWFSCNLIGTGTTDFDRSVASYYAFASRGTTASTAVNAQLQFDLTYEFRGLGNSQQYTLLARESELAASVAGWAYRVPFTPDDTGAWPTSVMLGQPGSEQREYVPKSDPPKPM